MKNYFETINIDWVLIIEFNNNIDQEKIESVFRQIESVSENPYTIIDLWNINYINSTFIGYLYHIYDTRNNAWNHTYICNACQKILDPLNLTWVLDIIPYFKNKEDAIKKTKK